MSKHKIFTIMSQELQEFVGIASCIIRLVYKSGGTSL